MKHCQFLFFVENCYSCDNVLYKVIFATDNIDFLCTLLAERRWLVTLLLPHFNIVQCAVTGYCVVCVVNVNMFVYRPTSTTRRHIPLCSVQISAAMTIRYL